MMVFSVLILLFLLFLSGVLSFVLNVQHLMNSLLCLEFLAIMAYTLLSTVFLVLSGDFFILFYYLVMVVCEGVLGLSLLVVLAYNYSSDLMMNMNLVSC